MMQELIKIAVIAVLVLTLAPFAGFWVVALAGAGLLLLPLSAIVAKFFPKTWERVEHSLFPHNSLPAA